MLVGVRQVTYGGDSGNRIFVLYWRCSLIRVSVIRGSTVLAVYGHQFYTNKWKKNYFMMIQFRY
jgi:hypothetical protein